MKDSVKDVFKRNPWLHFHFGAIKESIGHASVERMDYFFLGQATGTTVFNNPEHPVGKTDIFLFAENGKMLSRVQYEMWYNLWDMLRYHRGRTLYGTANGRRVYEAMQDLGPRIDKCHFGVELTPGWLVLLLPPKDISVKELFTTYMAHKMKPHR